MKKLIFVTLLLLGFVGNSHAVIYNFDSLPPSGYDESTFNSFFTGISFNNTGGNDFGITPNFPGPPFSSPQSVLNIPYWTSGNSTIATLTTPTNFFSVTLGDYDADSDNIYLYAYDSGNNLIDSDSYTLPYDLFGGYTLEVSSLSSNIKWVEYYGVGENNNTVYWDNVSFNEGAAVPEPATMILLGSGLLGLWGARKKFKR